QPRPQRGQGGARPGPAHRLTKPGARWRATVRGDKLPDDVVLVQRRGAVGVLLMNRTRQLNALSEELMSALGVAAEALDRGDAIGALVITGGPDVFAAGADLKQMA